MTIQEGAHAPANLFFVDGGRRLTDAQSPEQSVGLLFVVYGVKAQTVAMRSKFSKYVNQAVSSSRQVQQLNPALPTALATNFGLDESTFDQIVSLNQSRMQTTSIWEMRLAALSLSPFALTLALDASSFACSRRLHATLLHSLHREHFDFAANFESSPLLVSSSSHHGSQLPAHVEDISPHNFAMLVRRGNGSAALLRRWRAHMGEPGLADDQLALRATLRSLAKTGYEVCDDGLPWWRIVAARVLLRFRESAADLASLDLRSRAQCTHSVHVRVGRLTERVLGFKSADKKMPGWRMVPPRYTRPIVGEALLVHSGGTDELCAEINRESPTPRIVTEVPRQTRGAVASAHGAFASFTNRTQCARVMAPSRWHLAPAVCSFLPMSTHGTHGIRHGAAILVEPLHTFWHWVVAQGLTNTSAVHTSAVHTSGPHVGLKSSHKRTGGALPVNTAGNKRAGELSVNTAGHGRTRSRTPSRTPGRPSGTQHRKSDPIAPRAMARTVQT